jgi:clan AA aspartic protease
MGTFCVAVEVASLRDDRFEFVEALVDTGASHSFFPASFLEELGVQPTERWPFRLADERQREFDLGMARIRIDGREAYTTVAFADAGMEPVLGAVALEELRLAVDPVGRRLIPVPGLLL